MLTEQLLEGIDNVLAEARIVYLIVYVNDLAASRAFYEDRLGLRVIEADEGSVKYDVGQVILLLNRASDYGVKLAGRRDDASDIVFLVDDINSMRQALEERGVVFVRRRTYEIGLVTDFYDPSGHRLMIYQPSQEALSWESGKKLREVWHAFGKGQAALIGPPAIPIVGNGKDAEPPGLDGKPLIYLFMFVPSSAEALAYYQNDLGLKPVEQVHCCNPACPPTEMGVAKYDGGGMLLTTHHVHRTPVVDDFGKVYSPRAVDPEDVKGIVPVFHVTGIEGLVENLTRKGVKFSQGVVRSQIGVIARFEAVTGHAFYLYEPSREALKWPSGAKIQQILAT
jgi:catechol 2,3-dioxygenase-like lactoylglutathione lyase family enzyme